MLQCCSTFPVRGCEAHNLESADMADEFYQRFDGNWAGLGKMAPIPHATQMSSLPAHAVVLDCGHCCVMQEVHISLTTTLPHQPQYTAE